MEDSAAWHPAHGLLLLRENVLGPGNFALACVSGDPSFFDFVYPILSERPERRIFIRPFFRFYPVSEKEAAFSIYVRGVESYPPGRFRCPAEKGLVVENSAE